MTMDLKQIFINSTYVSGIVFMIYMVLTLISSFVYTQNIHKIELDNLRTITKKMMNYDSLI